MKQYRVVDVLHEEESMATDTLQSDIADTTRQIPVVTGMKGEPMPYKMESDEVIVGSLIFSFVLILFALQRGSHSLALYLKGAVTLRRRTNSFEEKVSASSISTFALCLSTVLLSSVCLYRNYAIAHLEEEGTPIVMFSMYTLAMVLLIEGKFLLYKFVNWVFFTRKKSEEWRQNYWGLIAAVAVILFPSVLYAVFLDSEIQISDYLLIMILVIVKMLLFYKLIGNFFSHFYGVIHLILYFCALEIIPDLLLWKGVAFFNNVFLKL